MSTSELATPAPIVPTIRAVTFWGVAGGVTLLGFVVSLWASWHFYQRHVYFSIDNLFDADPATYLRYVLGHPDQSRRHPLMLWFTLPVSLLAGAGEALTGWAWRSWAGILWGPMIGVAQSLLLFATLRRCALPLGTTLAIGLIDNLSLVKLTVGSVPESFEFTAAAFALLAWLAAKALSGDKVLNWWWLSCGVLLGGVTITNVAPWALVYSCVARQLGSSWRTVWRATLQPLFFVVLLIGGLYGMLLLCFHPPVAGHSNNSHLTNPVSTRPDISWFHFAPGPMFAALPYATAYAFTGPRPAFGNILPSTIDSLFLPGHSVPLHTVQLPPDGGSLGWPISLVLVHALILLGLTGWWARWPWRKQLALPLLLVVGWQLLLHCFWGGDDLFLYVLHWQTPLLLLMAGVGYKVVSEECWLRWIAMSSLGVLILYELLTNLDNLQFILRILEPQLWLR